jgi:hypothetical protein
MNIELDEVVVQDVSDDALELAAGGAGGAQGGGSCWANCRGFSADFSKTLVLAIANS